MAQAIDITRSAYSIIQEHGDAAPAYAALKAAECAHLEDTHNTWVRIIEMIDRMGGVARPRARDQ